jgi:transcriptional regulator with XRE-family HTH domain
MEGRPEPQPVKALLRERRLTYRDVAAALGVSFGTVHHAVNAWGEPSPEVRDGLAALLGVPADELFRPLPNRPSRWRWRPCPQCPHCAALMTSTTEE